MQPITDKNFGVVIAYLLPGFIALYGMSYQSDNVRAWLIGGQPEAVVTVGGFLYSTLAALCVGLHCSTIRWLILDSTHHKTGLLRPSWDYKKLQDNLGAYTLLEDNHYRYYQFYGNSLVAWIIGYTSWRISERDDWICWPDAVLILVLLVNYLGSRDTLKKYYRRVRILLSGQNDIIVSSARYHEKYG